MSSEKAREHFLRRLTPQRRLNKSLACWFLEVILPLFKLCIRSPPCHLLFICAAALCIIPALIGRQGFSTTHKKVNKYKLPNARCIRSTAESNKATTAGGLLAPISSAQRRCFSVFPAFSCSSIATKCCWLWHLMKVPKVKWKKKGCMQLFWRRSLLCCVSLRFQKHDLILVCIRVVFFFFLFFILCVLINLFFFYPKPPSFPFLFKGRKLFELFIYFFIRAFLVSHFKTATQTLRHQSPEIHTVMSGAGVHC